MRTGVRALAAPALAIRPPPEPASPITQRFLKPDWTRLKLSSKKLVDVKAALGWIRKRAESELRASLSGSSYRSSSTRRRDHEKKEGIAALGKWIGVLNKQITDVGVVSRKNSR